MPNFVCLKVDVEKLRNSTNVMQILQSSNSLYCSLQINIFKSKKCGKTFLHYVHDEEMRFNINASAHKWPFFASGRNSGANIYKAEEDGGWRDWWGGRGEFQSCWAHFSTCGKEWSGAGIMKPGRQNGREMGLRFQPDRGAKGAGQIFRNKRRFIEGNGHIKPKRLAPSGRCWVSAAGPGPAAGFSPIGSLGSVNVQWSGFCKRGQKALNPERSLCCPRTLLSPIRTVHV